jgi:hypothetical protein
MLRDVQEVRPLEHYQLWLRFEDGVTGTVDLRQYLKFQGVFAPLRDVKEFAKVTVNHELGVVSWPGGADLDADVLYAAVTGRDLNFH